MLIDKIKKDNYRYYKKYKLSLREKNDKRLKIVILYRKANYYSNNKFLKYYHILKYNMIANKYLIQIPYKCKIGNGFYIGHLGNIIINPNVIIGDNVNIANGVCIGQENRGKRKGTPVIGNKVWIGANAVIVGNIKIGDNVLIAPNTFVNFDVPNDSIVIGSPGKIISNKNATDGYINNIV